MPSANANTLAPPTQGSAVSHNTASMASHQHAAVPRFQTLEFLGKGGQGFVQLALDSHHQRKVAIKYIDRGWSRGFYKYVLRETLNHQQLSLCKHPHIVEFYEVFLTPSYLAVVMEYVPGTNLQQYLENAGGKLPEDVARFIFQQLIFAVDFCHRKGKVNRDIKLANILLQDGQLPLVKLCDFGFSKDKFDDSEPQTQIGTALFTAPEIFTNVPGQVYDAEAADIWSCGVVLFVMLFGSHPFLGAEDVKLKKHAQVMKLIENAVKGNIQVPAGAENYPEALQLISQILVSVPGQRCKMPEVMSSRWFQDKLPPGAMVLNSAYLAMQEVPVAELRQTPEEVQAIITAAVSVSPQEEAKSDAMVSLQPESSAVSGNTSQSQAMMPRNGSNHHVQRMQAASPVWPEGEGHTQSGSRAGSGSMPAAVQRQASASGMHAHSGSGLNPGAPPSSPALGGEVMGPSHDPRVMAGQQAGGAPSRLVAGTPGGSRMPASAMDISGNVLFDSELLYQMNLEQVQ